MLFALLIAACWWFASWLPKRRVTSRQGSMHLVMIYVGTLFANTFIGFWVAGLLAEAAGTGGSFAAAVTGAMVGFILGMTVGGWSTYRAARVSP